MQRRHHVIVIGAGHAGIEAAWAAANLGRDVALVTMDASKIGVMSCNPAIGGLAKGQMVREIDALGGAMALITDATGIMFKTLNTSKGPAVQSPRAQCDKHAYAREAQRLIRSRPNIAVIEGAAERFLLSADQHPRIAAVTINTPQGERTLHADAVVLTTGTFMRALMHTGPDTTQGGRIGEAAAVTISDTLRQLGFELGRLKTGTPPRLKRSTIDWDTLEPQWGDNPPTPFSDLTQSRWHRSPSGADHGARPAHPFPALQQTDCRITATTPESHELIRANLHRAPMYSGQITSVGPRYCPSIEDKVVRFAHRESHHVFLEPESHETDWVYCNGISTSLPRDVQDHIVHSMKGCDRAEILQHGYAVEYDMVRPHQITAGAMTRIVAGLFLAGQINGTSGYEEAAAQGLIAGLNAARWSRHLPPVTLGRDAAYIGVMMDDLVTKTPVEPYRMFTSRAEHRLLLRADNAADRLTPLARDLGLIDDERWAIFEQRRRDLRDLNDFIDTARTPEGPLADLIKRPEFTTNDLAQSCREHQSAPKSTPSVSERAHQRTPSVSERAPSPGTPSVSERASAPLPSPFHAPVLLTALADRQYEGYIKRQRALIKRLAETEQRRIPASLDPASIPGLRAEARDALARFRPETFGQAGRLEGVSPADLTLLLVAAGV